eukprot:300551_1
MLLFSITSLSIAILIRINSVTSKGWVLQSNTTYIPLDFCMFDRLPDDFSYYYTCVNHELVFSAHTGITCNQSWVDMFTNKPYDCDVDNIYTDYLEYTVWDLNLVDQNAECTNKDTYNRPNSQARVINKCLYEPRYGLYKMDTCTDTIWTTLRYSDPNCENLMYRNNLIEQCKDNETFVEISTCSTKMNSIGDEIGYIQSQKNSVLRPLDQCVTSDTESYLFTCHNDNPYMYVWPHSHMHGPCDQGNITSASDIFQLTPFSFSCSPNAFDYAILHIYDNDDNCGALDAQRQHTSFPLIVNQCATFFDENNTMKSEMYHCDNASLWSIVYNLPDCNDENGKDLAGNYSTEICSNNNTKRYVVECEITGLIIGGSTITTTAQPISTYAPSTTTTPAPTPIKKRIIYVTSDGEDYCTFDGHCGTLKAASYAANWQFQYYNLTDVEIIIQGQNPIAINRSLHRYASKGIVANPCLPHNAHYMLQYFRSITYTFDPNYIQSMNDWYNATLCENMDTETNILYEHFFGTSESLNVLFTFIINNLIIDSYSFEGRINQPYYIAAVDTFICNDCIFRNIEIHSDHHDRLDDTRATQFPTLIVAANIELRNCIIDNITYIPSSGNDTSWAIDEYGYDEYDHSFLTVEVSNTHLEIESHSFSLSITNSSRINNINGLSSVVYILTDAFVFDFYGLIENVTFDTISVTDAIVYYYHDGTTTTLNSLNIRDTSFFNVDHGSILISPKSAKADIELSNIHITTAQTIASYLSVQESIGRDNLDYYSLFVFDAPKSTIVISNVHVEYLYAHEMSIRCENKYHDTTLMTVYAWALLAYYADFDLDFYHFHYMCEHPIQVIHNNAVLNINELHVSNDITDSIIDEFRAYIQDEYDSVAPYLDSVVPYLGIDPDHDLYIEFEYVGDLGYGMIFNERYLNVESLYVYGYGVHHSILLNIGGDLNVNNLMAIPDIFCTDNNESCTFDADALQIQYWIRFKGTDTLCDALELHVQNSFLFGAKAQSIAANVGYIYLQNVTIQNSVTAIAATPSVTYLELMASTMEDIGTYYAGSSRRFNANNGLFVPFLLRALTMVITDTIFSFVSPFQFDLFDAGRYWDSIFLDSFQVRTITLLNNMFEINDVNVLSRYPSNQSLSFLDELDFSVRSHNNVTNVFSQPFFFKDGMMLIPNDANMQIVNNNFTINANNLYVNANILIDNNIPFISSYTSNNGTNITSNVHVCISGNEFSNFAIWLKNDNFNITSCVKRDIVDYMHKTDCYSYGTFGSIHQYEFDTEYEANVFNIHSNRIDAIIKAEKDTFIALENNKINIHMNDTTILNMINGNYLLVDTQIDYKNVLANDTMNQANILVNNDNCDINCYSHTDHRLFISVLHVTCPYDVDNSSSLIDNVYDAQNYSLSPKFIDVFPLNNNSEYVPGQKLKLMYSFYDMNYNAIQNELIRTPIVLSFESTSTDELVPNFQLIINENGECPQCVDGITLSSIKLDAVGKNYSFNALVSSNQLVANDALTVIITDCPAGYGSTGTEICDVCNRGYFNVFSTDNNMCYYCNENAVEGVSCPGSSDIIIDYLYWVSIYQYSHLYESIFDANTTQYIVSYKCPGLYCCQLDDGCNLVDDHEYLCAKNKEFEAPLCGKCKDGYSELFGTDNCGECDYTHWGRLSFPFIYGLLWALFILVSKSTKLENASKNTVANKCCCKPETSDEDDEDNDDTVATQYHMTRSEYLERLQIMLTKIILYYYQGLSYILTTSGIRHALYGFVELSNMNIFAISSSGNPNGYCLLQNMNMVQKITIPLFTTAVIAFVTISVFLLSKCGINMCCCCKRRMHFGKSIISLMLICVGQVLSVLFKLLACRDIGSLSVHYFFGAYQCFDMTWSVSVACLAFLFASFIASFVWIWYKKRKDTDNHDEVYEQITQCYRDDVWYWECILFVRRSVLALAFIVFDNAELKASVGIGFMIYLLAHMYCTPFKNEAENILETSLIVATAICIFIDAIYSSKANSIFSNVLISLLIVFPLILYFIFMVMHCKALVNASKKVVDIDIQGTDIQMCNRRRTYSESDQDPDNIAMEKIIFVDGSGLISESSDMDQLHEGDVKQKSFGRYTSIPV